MNDNKPDDDSASQNPNPSATRRSWLVVIFAIAFLARFLATMAFEGIHEGPRLTGFSDGVEFNAIATNLVQNSEFAVETGAPTSFRAPGFPLALAGVYAIAGVNNFVAAHIFFCLVGAALVLAVYGLAREMVDPPTALLAAGITALYPNVLYYNIHFASEPLYTLLLTLAVWSFVRAIQGNGLALFIISGLLLGGASLTRPLAIYFAPLFFLVGAWLKRKEARAVLPGLIVYAVSVTIVIAPWTIRNERVHDRFLLLASNGGSTFWGSNNEIVLNDPKSRGQWITTNRLEEKNKVMQLTNEVDRDRLEWQYGQEYLRAHVSSIPRLLWYKFREFVTPFCKTPNRKFNLIILVSYGGLLPFMLAGLVWFTRISRERFTAISVLTVPLAGTLLGSLAFYGSARFRSTIEPILIIGAAAILMCLVRKIVTRGHTG